jgi:hypothetical protein
MKITTMILHPTVSLAQGICHLANTESTRPLATLVSLTVLPIFLAFEGAAKSVTLIFGCYFLTKSQFEMKQSDLNNIGSKLAKIFQNLQNPTAVARELLPPPPPRSTIDQLEAPENPQPTDFKSQLQAWIELETDASVKTAKQTASARITACFEAQQVANRSRTQEELAKKLNLSGLAINNLPECLAELKPCLRELDLSNTQLTKLPENLNQLTHLHTLRCAGLKNVTIFPTQLLQLKSLLSLDLTDCSIKKISVNEISKELTKLKTLNLAGNPLDTDTTDEITRRHALNASQQRTILGWQGLQIITQ